MSSSQGNARRANRLGSMSRPRYALFGVGLTLVLGIAACAAPSSAPTETLVPVATPSPTPVSVDPIAERVESMAIEEKVASMLMLHHPGTDPDVLRAFVDRYALGGLIMMGDNMPAAPEQLASLTGALRADDAFPLLLGIDEEGGIVTRLPWDDLPGADVLKWRSPDETAVVFGERARLLAEAGLSINFGIVADETSDPGSFIYDRVFGTDPLSASAHVSAAVSAERGTVYSTIKHFPGHGAAPGDSHLMVPATDMSIDEWRATDALPFSAGIDAGAEFVMFGHLAYTAIDPAPASLSSAWHGILRSELGFDGVTITDDMLMLQHTDLPEFADPYENAIRAIAAGTDMLLYVLPADPADVDIDVDLLITTIAGAITDGRIDAAAVDASVTRLLELRAALAHEHGSD